MEGKAIPVLIERLPDWEQRLADFIAARQSMPFAWGSNDCALFATAAAAAITGVDRAEVFRGRYDSREGAMLALREVGQGTLLKTMDHLYPRKPLGFAQRGDLVARGKGKDMAIGVCMGPLCLFVGQEGEREGLVSVPRGDCSRAWGI